LKKENFHLKIIIFCFNFQSENAGENNRFLTTTKNLQFDVNKLVWGMDDELEISSIVRFDRWRLINGNSSSGQ